MYYNKLKADKNSIWLNRGRGQNVLYLDVDDTLDEEKLKSDIKNGAVILKELPNVLKSDELPHYTVIYARNESNGILAASYLASIFNKREGIAPKKAIDDSNYTDTQEMDDTVLDDLYEGNRSFHEDDDDDFSDSPSNSDDSDMYFDPDGAWIEDPWRIPIIRYNEIECYEESNRSFDSQSNMLFGAPIQPPTEKPYWTALKKEPVIIGVDVNMISSAYIGDSFSPSANTDSFSKRFERFKNNRHVFIVFIENQMYGMESQDKSDESDNKEALMSPLARIRIGSLLLNYLAETVTVVQNLNELDRYRERMFLDWVEIIGCSLAPRFPTKRILKKIFRIQTFHSDDSDLLEKTVRYIAKKRTSNGPLTEEDFDSLSKLFLQIPRFDTYTGKSPEKILQNELVGLDHIKDEIMKMVDVQKYNRLRAKHCLPTENYHNVHLLLGPPGTAKTTVAKITGEIMVQEGLLGGCEFIDINGAELKGKYVGHTAPKVKALFDEYDIILIDEAYSIVSDNGTDDSFSKEALAQLMIELEEHATDRLVFFAGYGGKDVSDKNNKMKAFLEANPGLRSRINSTLIFESYTAKQATDIFYKQAQKNHFKVAASARKDIEEYFTMRRNDENFGNGREARSLLENSVSQAAHRIMQENTHKITKEQLMRINKADVLEAIRLSQKGIEGQKGSTRNVVGF